MYAQRSSVGRGREHADYETLRRNLTMRDRDCRDQAAAGVASATPAANVTPSRPNMPSCLEGYPLAMVYAPTQAFEALYECEQWLEKGTIFKALDFPFKGTRKGR